jgi:Tol biopolymer transport system component
MTIWASTNAAAIVSALFAQNNATSYHPQLSDDGRYVAFKVVTNSSVAGFLLTMGATAVILQYDTTTGATTVVNTNGIGGWVDPDEAYGPEMTPDGRYIAFAEHEGSFSSGYSSVHVWDVQLATDILVSDNGSGVPPNTTSHTPSISPDGRFVAFLSNASDLVGNVVTNEFHVYLRDLQSHITQLVDVDTNGIGSTDDTMTTLSLSVDGRCVAFSSPDGSLTSLDINGAEDVFVRDMVAGATEMVSQRDATVILQAADGFSTLSPPSVSSDGRWVAFTSRADNLVFNDTNQNWDIFVRDLVNGTSILVSGGFDGGPALGGNSRNAVISADGRYVVFISSATNLVTGPVNTKANVFRRDPETGTTALVSVGTDGVSPGNNDASAPAISPDGRYVVFLSQASNLAAGITGGLYWRDMNLGQTMGLSGASSAFGPTLSDNGRYVGYASGTSPLTTRVQIWDTQLGKNIYTNASSGVTSAAIDPTGTKILYRISPTICVDDIATGSNLFSIMSPAPIRNATCWSDDGRWLAFLSTTNLGFGYDSTDRVYLRDFQAGTLFFVGVAGPSTNGWPTVSDGPAMSGNGRFVAYRSIATNTVLGVNIAPPNMLLFDRLMGSNVVLTVGQAGSGPIPWVSQPVISYDGTMVAFSDLGSELVNGDLNRVPDAFGALIDGSLQVTINPAAAVSAGAQWQVDGGAWQNSGATVAGLPVGSHTVAFSIVPGWGVPVSQVVTVNVDETTTITAGYLTPHPATATAIMIYGFVVAVTITDAGIGYTNTPPVYLVGGGGSGAQAVATVSNGVVTGITVINAGFGYTSTPIVAITPPFPLMLGIAPATYLTFTNLTVGTNYQLQVSQARIWTNLGSSFVASASNYSQYFDGSVNGSLYRLVALPIPYKATATPILAYGFVVAATVNDGGYGYVSVPVVQIVGGGGVRAQATATISNGVVTAINIMDAGFGYTNTPTIQIDPPPVPVLPPNITPAFRLEYSGLTPALTYQLQASPDFAGWTNFGTDFTATASTNSQYLNVGTGSQFFRLSKP